MFDHIVLSKPSVRKYEVLERTEISARRFMGLTLPETSHDCTSMSDRVLQLSQVLS